MKLHHETTIKESQARNIPPIFILKEHKTTIYKTKKTLMWITKIIIPLFLKTLGYAKVWGRTILHSLTPRIYKEAVFEFNPWPIGDQDTT